MRRRRSLLFLICAVLVGGCATAATMGPEGLARLERDQAANPQSAATNRALGIGYYQMKEYAKARPVLERAAALDSTDGTTQLFLGMTAEAQGNLGVARRAYSSYIRYGRTDRVRRMLEAHLAALDQKELVLAAKQEIANETRLASIPGPPNTVAVLPLSFTGTDTTLRPLGRGLAELLSTDLARSPRLVVVEREHVQALLDEIKLQQSGATNRNTGVRAGRMLQAGRLIAGGITQTGNDIRVDAPIINVRNAAVVASPSESRTLNQIFTLEQNLAFAIFDSLGIRLTTAERDQIDQRPTKSLAAFLAYSRGLTFEDEGRFDDAARLFDQALRLDPGFAGAAVRAQQSRAAAQGQQVTPAKLVTGLRGTGEGQVVLAATQGVVVQGTPGSGLTATALATAGGLNPSPAGIASAGGTATSSGNTQTPQRDNPGATVTGTDNIANMTAVITLVVQIPHL